MGFKQDVNTPPMERELNYLLYDLCVHWGFCIPPQTAERISKEKYFSADDFAEEVVEAEGLIPEYEKKWVRKIAEKFKEHFGCDEISISNFSDRDRSVKESW